MVEKSNHSSWPAGAWRAVFGPKWHWLAFAAGLTLLYLALFFNAFSGDRVILRRARYPRGGVCHVRGTAVRFAARAPSAQATPATAPSP